jgi:hypothetical protein
VKDLPLEARIAGFARRVGGYYLYPDSFFSSSPSATSNDDALVKPGETFHVEKFLIDDAELWKRCEKGFFDATPFAIYPQIRFGEFDADSQAFVREALTAMARTGVRRIRAVSTVHAPPGCMKGVRWLQGVMEGATPEKFDLVWVEGEYNHFLHNTGPELLWDAI